jgi:flagellar biosynthetic protein FliP
MLRQPSRRPSALVRLVVAAVAAVVPLSPVVRVRADDGVVPASAAVVPKSSPLDAAAAEGRPSAPPATVPIVGREAAGEGRAAREAGDASASLAGLLSRFTGGRSLDAVISAAVVFGVASLAPAVLLMTTCFVRMSVVLSLVRQGLGTNHLPSNQIVTSLALFLSAMVMWPVWTTAYREGVEPYQRGVIDLPAACERGLLPVRRWMATQIEQAGNRDTMLLFLARHPSAPKDVASYDDVPTETLLPAFLVSELETSFAIGLRLLLPFLVLDVIVAVLVVSTGLVMLPPTLVSLPLKLLVFVMADGWTLVIQSLLDSMQATAS